MAAKTDLNPQLWGPTEHENPVPALQRGRGVCRQLLPSSLLSDFQEMHKTVSARSLEAGSARLGQKGTSLFQGGRVAPGVARGSGPRSPQATKSIPTS